jgi:bacillithiol biosynthesis cysteine-adding enzyme BshC
VEGQSEEEVEAAMTQQVECYPISILPNSSRLFLDYAEQREPLLPFFPSTPYSNGWMLHQSPISESGRAALAGILEAQNQEFGAGEKVFANISALRRGANAVVTGQQVTLLGGPLYTLFKAATAVRKAHDATAAGHPHVPIFWLATEDHDLDEADHVTFPSRHELHRLKLGTASRPGAPVGGLELGGEIKRVLDEAAGLLEPGPILDALQEFYRPDATFAGAFARLLSRVFAEHGLIVIDAASRECHALGAEVLGRAITSVGDLHAGLVERDQLLAERGYHSQVLVSPQSSLLFLMDAETGARLPLKRRDSGEWSAGKKSYSEGELLGILESEPERLSPNALLRPVFQDAILPTSAYIGGPAEIAYFAQSQALYERVLGRTTPVLPRLSATLIEPAVAEVLAKHELSLTDVISTRPEELAVRLGARTMPVENKRKLAAAGNALDAELGELTAYMKSLDEGLGRSADVAASKMRYQMNRLRRLSANYQLQREASLRRHADALALALFPDGHLQERLMGAAWFLSRYGEGLTSLLVEHAAQECPGHKGILV